LKKIKIEENKPLQTGHFFCKNKESVKTTHLLNFFITGIDFSKKL